jgi:hypothetical protein
MFENTIVKDIPPEDVISDSVGENVKNQFINILSENQFSISQTRCLFNSIISQFERLMPVTNHKNR